MKKIFFSVIAVATLLYSCDPECESGSFNADQVSADDLLKGATFEQYDQETDEAGNVSYVKSATGNYIKYCIPAVSGVHIYTLKADSSEFSLSTADPAGMISVVPSRGSDSLQTVYFRYVNQDNKEVVASRQFKVGVPADISYELKLLTSNASSTKTWKWDLEAPDGVVWGNMGYGGGSALDIFNSGSGKWWGVNFTTQTFEDQQGHRGSDTVTGDDDPDAYMVFDENGTVKCYDKSDNLLRSASFSISDFDNTYANDVNKMGYLNISGTNGGILWPYTINQNGAISPKYELTYLSATKMVLVVPGTEAEANGYGSWKEATFWRFTAEDNPTDLLAGYDSKNGKDWTWDISVNGCVWGNMGYCGGDGSKVGLSGEGQWWGINYADATFDTQLQHSVDGKLHGDEDINAYMNINSNGIITRCDANGNKINAGSWSYSADKSGSTWQVGTLNTDAGCILWPYAINMNGFEPTAFEVVYLSSDKLCLVYPGTEAQANGLGSWKEATFWHFKAK